MGFSPRSHPRHLLGGDQLCAPRPHVASVARRVRSGRVGSERRLGRRQRAPGVLGVKPWACGSEDARAAGAGGALLGEHWFPPGC